MKHLLLDTSMFKTLPNGCLMQVHAHTCHTHTLRCITLVMTRRCMYVHAAEWATDAPGIVTPAASAEERWQPGERWQGGRGRVDSAHAPCHVSVSLHRRPLSPVAVFPLGARALWPSLHCLCQVGLRDPRSLYPRAPTGTLLRSLAKPGCPSACSLHSCAPSCHHHRHRHRHRRDVKVAGRRQPRRWAQGS